MIRYATGVDLIRAITRYVVGDEPGEIEQKDYNGNWAEIVLHADGSGKFSHLNISDELKKSIVEEDLWVKPGDSVVPFCGANNTIGTLVIQSDNKQLVKDVIISPENYIKVFVE